MSSTPPTKFKAAKAPTIKLLPKLKHIPITFIKSIEGHRSDSASHSPQPIPNSFSLPAFDYKTRRVISRGSPASSSSHSFSKDGSIRIFVDVRPLPAAAEPASVTIDSRIVKSSSDNANLPMRCKNLSPKTIKSLAFVPKVTKAQPLPLLPDDSENYAPEPTKEGFSCETPLCSLFESVPQPISVSIRTQRYHSPMLCPSSLLLPDDF